MSLGRLPSEFLQGCGLSAWQIRNSQLYDPDLSPAEITQLQYEVFDLRTSGSIYVGGVFIAYSIDDARFVDELYDRLTDKGVAVWLDRHDILAGDRHKQVTRAIRLNDVVLLVLSQASVNSDWVASELELVRRKEREEGRDVLCPIALDDSWKEKFTTGSVDHVLWRQVAKKNVLDFSKWQFDESEPPFQKLLRGLKSNYPPSRGTR